MDRHEEAGSGGARRGMGYRSEITEDDEEHVPSFSSQLSAAKLWWKFAVWPGAFLLFNAVVFRALLAIDENEFRYLHRASFGGQQEGDGGDVFLLMFKNNCLVVAIVFFIDTVVLCWASLFLEKQVAEYDAAENGQPTVADPPVDSYVYAKVSRKMDLFLAGSRAARGGGRQAKVSIGVSLLYILTVLSCAVCLTSAVFWNYANTASGKELCSFKRREESRFVKDEDADDDRGRLDKIPGNLRKWASRVARSYYAVDYGIGDVIHMTDGATFFSSYDPTPSAPANDGDADDDMFADGWEGDIRQVILLSASKDGSLISHRNVTRPRGFVRVRGDGNLAAQTFCCVYDEPPEEDFVTEIRRRRRRRRRRFFGGGGNSRALCVDAGEDISRGFRSVALVSSGGPPRDDWVFQWTSSAPFSDGGLYWFAIGWYAERGGKQLAEFYTLAPDTMNVSMVTSVFRSESGSDNIISDSDKCGNRLMQIGSLVVSAILFPAGLWLLKKKDLAAGLAPICAAIFVTISCFSLALAKGLGFLALIATAVALLGRSSRRVSSEQLLWILYSTLACLAILCWTNEHDNDTVLLGVLTVVAGIVLNHPVMELFGWIGGTGMVLSPFIFWEDTGSEEFVSLIFFGVIGGCGLVTAGRTLRKYRAYMIFYSRRLMRALEILPTLDGGPRNRASRDDGNRETTAGLLNRTDV